MEQPKENITIINNYLSSVPNFSDIARYAQNIQELTYHLPNFPNVTNVNVYNIASNIYDAASNVPSSFGNGLKQVVHSVTDKTEIKDMLKQLDENDLEIVKLVTDAFVEKVCTLKKETHLTYDCNVIRLKACVTFSEVNMAGKIYKFAHNSCHSSEEALSIATILRNDEVRKQILNKCSNNNDAKIGLTHLLCGHNGEAREILREIIVELLIK